ncbi:hypothetical protein LOC68_14475 [Blastopirellula sp. JC732]|uniref:Uncharacterized protein n=1 Tax=Blastopirellula sediminis TaxID=2894196 RepID=A0A9X1MNU4_9BACT|nr:hypothetical protein [Blastopirellula sediminis]MCC9607112.1 hypothetical protein [Blastopirellula sediminis]MCC9629595.1 hypothetical protein [Blastopirellula sediminis]
MHAAVLLMCVTIAGADVRESISTPQALSDLLTREAKQTSEVTWKFLEAGAVMESTLHFDQNQTQKITSHLVIVPCPGHPNLILAGHVVPPSGDQKINHYEGLTSFAALIDVDRNLISPIITNHRLNTMIPAQEAEDVARALERLGQQYCDRIAANPEKHDKSFMRADLKRTFINPPPITIECLLDNFNMNDMTFYSHLQVTGGDRRLKKAVNFKFSDLLMSELAVPAAEYFASKNAAVRKEGVE